jgi:hypothetical protein
MKYFKVKPESGQVRLSNVKTDFLIAGELKTENELKKFKLTDTFMSTHFEPVEYNKNATYFQFGARFKNSVEDRPLRKRKK